MQEVIVYRNPLEAAFWYGVMDGSFFPIIVAVVVFFAVFLILNALAQKVCVFLGFWRGNQGVYATYASMAVAIGAAVLVAHRMFSVL